MLRNLGIRSKLLAVLAVPMLVLIVGASVVSLQAVNAAKDARQVRAIADGAQNFSALVSALQAERRVSEAKLQGDYTLGAQLKSIRATTDRAADVTDELTSGIGLAQLSNEAAKALATNLQARGKLASIRKQIDKGTVSAAAVGAVYSAAIAEEIQIPARIGASLPDRTLAIQLRSYTELGLAAELATQERDLGRQLISDPSQVAEYTALVARENDALAAYWYDASIAERSRMTRVMDSGTVNRQFNAAQASLLNIANGRATSVQDQTWVYLSNKHLDTLEGLGADVAKAASVAAADSASSATHRAWQVLGLALLVLLLPILLALVVARAITRPLRHLTDAAGQVRDELPRLVENMATPGETPDADLIRIPVTSQDEVGKLAAAFNDVNQTTMKIAREQAALRGSIAEMFVNVARRNHVLLSRQLSFIDQLERTEENPDTLDDLFKLDHLATRMRRNAESLIVLAGIDSGRRVRQAMPLSDVVRTAISEIEKYERVDMALRADPPVVGHVALTTAHLLAELLENATQFSNPDTRVFVVTSYSRRGVRVKITDAGLGMTYDEITDANQRIANPPATDVVGASRLGFFVVGRLARRLDARVTLRAARDRGTVVVIDLPAALFVPGTVAEVTGIDDDDEVAATPESGDPASLPSGAAAAAASGASPADGSAAPGALPSRGLPPANPHTPRVPSSSAPPPAAPVKAATPFPYDFGAPAGGAAPTEPADVGATASLPQRGAAALPQRGGGSSLPKREPAAAVRDLASTGPAASEAVPMPAGTVAPTAPAPEPPVEMPTSHRRPGLFSGFRSQRPAVAKPDPLLTPLPELPAEVAAAPADEVVAEAVVESVAEAVAEPVAEPVAESVVEPVVEAVAEPAHDVAGEVPVEISAPVEEVAPVGDAVAPLEDTVEIAAVVQDEAPAVEDEAALVEEAPVVEEPLIDDVLPVADVLEPVESVESVELVELVEPEEPVEPLELTNDIVPVEDSSTAEPVVADPSVEDEVVYQPWVPQSVTDDEPVAAVEEPDAAPRATVHFFPTQRRSTEADDMIEPVAEPEPVAEVEPEPVVDLEPVAEPEPVAEVEPEPVVDLEPVAEAEPVEAAEAELPTRRDASVAQRASVFQSFPTRRSRGRHYKGKDDAAPAAVAPEAVGADVEPAAVVPEPVAEPVAFVPEPVAVVPEPVAEPVAISAEPAAEPEVPVAAAFLDAEPVVEAEPAPEPEPFVPAPPAPPAPPVGMVDILPGNGGGGGGRGLRLPRIRSRAMKAPIAPLPSRPTTPPAYTQSPVPPPVAPLPVEAPVPSPVPVPVPATRSMDFPVRASASAPAPEFASASAAAPSLPEASHFGTRAGDPSDQASSEVNGLFGQPVPANVAPSAQTRHELEELQLRERSAIASEALSELSRLSGYRPQAVENRGEESLARRTPQSTPGTAPATEVPPAVPHRERNATDVRSMLSGFRAGVERGRADQSRDSDD